jgi:hypothetical protein
MCQAARGKPINAPTSPRWIRGEVLQWAILQGSECQGIRARDQCDSAHPSSAQSAHLRHILHPLHAQFLEFGACTVATMFSYEVLGVLLEPANPLVWLLCTR